MKTFKMFIGLFLVFALCAFIAPSPVGGAQGDEVWTEMGPVGWDSSLTTCNPGADGSGATTYGVVFPYDNNAQVVLHYIDVTAGRVGEDLEYFGYISQTTGYTRLTTAFSGGNTNFIHVTNASMVDVPSGVSYIVIDNQAGIAGWAELRDGTVAFDISTTLTLSAGASNFAIGPVCSNGINLSGVTFPVGSRVYPVFRIGRTLVGAGNVQYDNYPGLIAARTNGPLLAILQSGVGLHNGTGITIHAITAQYR